MYDLIYANGDSYTAGSGLAEHLYIDKPPLKKDDVTPDLRLKSDRKKHKCRKDWKSLEMQNAYPATLGKFANTQVINKAEGGAGLGNIAMTAARDLIMLSKKHEKIFAMISLTNPSRIFFPRAWNNTLLWNYKHNKMINKHNKIEQIVLETYAEKLDPIDLEIYNVLHFIGLVNIMDRIPNIDFIIVETPAFDISKVDLKDNYKVIKDMVVPHVHQLVPNYDEELQIHTTCCHVIKDYHDDFAKRIYNKVWKKN